MSNENSMADLPLAINLIGPLAIKKNGNLLDVWLPILSKKYPHQAAVGTDVDSHELKGTSEYSIGDPNPPCHPHPSVHYNPPKSHPSVPYDAAPKIYPPSSYFIHITLPRPKWIVGLSPVSCRVYDNATAPPPFDNKPIGFRLLYEKAGAPILTPSNGTDTPYTLNFDPAPDEQQLEMFIAYSPYNFSDYNHPEAKDDFKKLTGMFGLKLNVDFEFPFMTQSKKGKRKKQSPAVKVPPRILNGPAKDCKAPALLLK